MKLRQRTSLALLIYWGLLINLGPSLHTISWFGIHSSCGCCQPVVLDIAGDCGCGEQECCSLANNEFDASGSVAQQHLADDKACSFCEFFKKYQADSSSPTTFERQEEAEDIRAVTGPTFLSLAISSRARGPPSGFAFQG